MEDRAAGGGRPPLPADHELVSLRLDQDVVPAEARQLQLDEVSLGSLDDVGEGRPRPVEGRGLLEPLARQRLVEQTIHPLLQIQQLVEWILTERHHGQF